MALQSLDRRLLRRVRGRLGSLEWGSGSYRTPLERSDSRTLTPDYVGTIHTWDIDGTYLDTDVSSLSRLLLTALEFAVDKRAIPGTPALLKGIRRGVGPTHQQTPLYFVSASPPQLRQVIERKMLADGVEPDGITFKDQFHHILRGRPDQLRNHVGYKLAALLLNRRAHPIGSREYLYGDDKESDAVIYATYGAILDGGLRGDSLRWTLSEHGVHPDDARYITTLADYLPGGGEVVKIFIRMVPGSDPESLATLDERIIPIRDTFQAALVLWEQGEVDGDTVLQVVRDGSLEASHAATIDDAAVRHLIRVSTASRWRKTLARSA